MQTNICVVSAGLENDHDFNSMLDVAKTNDLSDLVDLLKPNTTELDLYGHQLEDFVWQCTFDREDCNIT